MFVKQTGILLLFSLTFLSSAAQSLKKPLKNGTHGRNTKIVGGYRCSIKRVPFLVSLRYLNSPQHFCAGSLLSEFWILTALHCLKTRYNKIIEVTAGSSFALDPKKNANHEALQFSIIAQCYFYSVVDDQQYDVSLARLKKAIRQTNSVAYVLLPFGLHDDDKSLIEICSNATVAGWGTQYVTSIFNVPAVYPVPEHDPHLRCIQVPVISRNECDIRSYTTILPSFFCTYLQTTDACHGDSGGPLTCNGYQYGIVSYGFGCAYKQFPGVYTNILFFKDFIVTTMKSSFNKERSSSKATRVTAELSLVLVLLVLKLFKII